jgi:pyrophosphatase PpaX
MIKAVVFDIDGTLIDTSEFIYQAYEHTIKFHDYPARTREDIATQIGKKIEDCYAFLTPGADYETLIKTHTEFQAANIALIQVFSNVAQIIEQLKASGLKVGLWTGRRHHIVESLINCGLEPSAFDCIVDATMTIKGKPDPEGLLITLKKLKVTPDMAIMVGDAGLDIAAGKKGKVAATIGLTHGFGTREELEQEQADFILDSLDDIQTVISKL